MGEQLLQVKGSGFATPGHAQDFRIILVSAFAPKPEQHQVSFTEGQVIGSPVPIREDVLVE